MILLWEDILLILVVSMGDIEIIGFYIKYMFFCLIEFIFIFLKCELILFNVFLIKCFISNKRKI